MPYHRHDKDDANAAGIISCLRAHGLEVIKTQKPVDLHIYDPKSRRSGWVEIKVSGENVTAKRHQLEFLSDARQPGTIVRSEDEALMFALTFEGWTDKQKDAIAKLLLRNPKSKLFQMKLVEKTIAAASSTGSTK